MPKQRLRFTWRSIRFRLAAWFGLALLAVAVGLGVSVHVLTSRALIERVDAMLDFEFEEALERLAPAHGSLDAKGAGMPAAFHESYLFRVRSADGRVLAESPGLAEVELGLGDASLEMGRRHETVKLRALGTYRVVAGSMDPASHGVELRIATSLEPYERALKGLDSILWTVLPAGAVLTSLLGYLIALQALSPVERMTRSAQRITAKNLHERLEIANPGDELGRLALTINSMLDRLDAAFVSNRRFTSDAAHELRTPLASIRTEAEVALIAPRDVGTYQAVLRSVVEESERLSRLTDRLLVLAREDAGLELVTKPVAMAEILSRAAERAADPRIQLVLSEDEALIVNAEAELLLRAVGNLLENAIVHAPGSKTIELVGRRAGERVEVEVRDQGPGLSAEVLPHVFDRFYRVDASRSRKTGGTGLGLSIVKAVAERHGGGVSATSVPGRGAAFGFWLPAASAAAGVVTSLANLREN